LPSTGNFRANERKPLLLVRPGGDKRGLPEAVTLTTGKFLSEQEAETIPVPPSFTLQPLIVVLPSLADTMMSADAGWAMVSATSATLHANAPLKPVTRALGTAPVTLYRRSALPAPPTREAHASQGCAK